MTQPAPFRIVVMGVAGAGKTSLGQALARRGGASFVDADAAHPAANVAKMAAGEPLTDDDRWPWLAALRAELRRAEPVVVTCSALRRMYRDLLRGAGGVRFVFLSLPPEQARSRLASRRGHFMGAGMAESQFATLEEPEADETDVLVLDATMSPEELLDAVERGLVSVGPGTAVAPLLAEGDEQRVIEPAELRALVHRLCDEEIVGRGARRILLVPPDQTRLHSGAGEITALLYERAGAAGCEVAVLPAVGTHAAMSPSDVHLLFGEAVPYERVLHHRWRDGLVRVGEIGAAEMAVISGERIGDPVPIEVDAELLAGYDLVVSIGQVVPHEVIGMANFTKNLVIGLGGAPTIHRSHFLGALSDMETIMGRATSPVRDVVDAAFDRFVAGRVRVLWLLTVVQDTPGGPRLRGLFAGHDRSGESGGAAYRAAATLARRCNVAVVDRALDRVAAWLDPHELRTTWVGNKAVYRTRMAIADGGELVVLAPGVARCGEDPAIDALIRRHGYRGTAATLAALGQDPELAANLGVAAHLIHGSSEGRFRVVYCTDPSSGGLTRDEVEAVGYEWRSLADELSRLRVTGDEPSGPRVDADGEPYTFITNPALGLWSTADRLR